MRYSPVLSELFIFVYITLLGFGHTIYRPAHNDPKPSDYTISALSEKREGEWSRHFVQMGKEHRDWRARLAG